MQVSICKGPRTASIITNTYSRDVPMRKIFAAPDRYFRMGVTIITIMVIGQIHVIHWLRMAVRTVLTECGCFNELAALVNRRGLKAPTSPALQEKYSKSYYFHGSCCFDCGASP